jgi:hypothetical protein
MFAEPICYRIGAAIFLDFLNFIVLDSENKQIGIVVDLPVFLVSSFRYILQPFQSRHQLLAHV